MDLFSSYNGKIAYQVDKCCLKPLKCRFESCVLHIQFEYFSIIKAIVYSIQRKNIKYEFIIRINGIEYGKS